MSVEMTLSRETLCFERLALAREEQVSVEGEATLPGSMRDAVTVLSVQAQAYLEDARTTAGGMTLRGHVSFQALYTQGDLTRIRAMETTCDFEHSIDAPELQPDMRVNASVAVQETEGTAASGRMTLRALLDLQIEAFETTRQALVTDAAGDADALRTRMQRVAFCRTAPLGEEKTLVREEFDLPARLEVGDVLSATGEAAVAELTGGAGRIGVSGTVEVRVLHRPQEAGNPLVMTSHELPFELSIDTQIPDGAQIHAQAEAIDVMADSMADDKRRTLRVEAEVRVRLSGCVQEEKELLEDLYSVSGDALIPQKERFDVHAFEESSDVRESIRLPIALAKDAPPIGTALAAFAQPTITAATPAGKHRRRLAEERGEAARRGGRDGRDADLSADGFGYPDGHTHARAVRDDLPHRDDRGCAGAGARHRGDARTGDQRPRGGALRRGAACCQARRAPARRGDRRGAAARRPAGARLRTRLAGQGGIPLGDGQAAARCGGRTASRRKGRDAGVSKMTPRARKRPLECRKKLFSPPFSGENSFLSTV